jgi:hypothetical protein
LISGTLPFASRDEVERRVEVRMARREVLQNENPLELWGIIDEAVLRRQVGGSAVMRAQFRHILEASELPNITFQVIPFDGGAHPGMAGSFIALQFVEEAIPAVIYVESMAGELFLEHESDVRRYKLMFEHLRAVAASPDVSRSLLGSLAAEK